MREPAINSAEIISKIRTRFPEKNKMIEKIPLFVLDGKRVRVSGPNHVHTFAVWLTRPLTSPFLGLADPPCLYWPQVHVLFVVDGFFPVPIAFV